MELFVWLPQYGVVFDAGSTHTALFLYQWVGNKENNTGIVSQKQSCDVDGEYSAGNLSSSLFPNINTLQWLNYVL